MQTKEQLQKLRGLSFSSITLGVVGGLCYWWVPFGMVLSTAGLVLGFIDWVSTRRRSLDHRLSVFGVVISAATLILDIVIALLGLQLVTFGGRP
jgi:hypothetical protein